MRGDRLAVAPLHRLAQFEGECQPVLGNCIALRHVGDVFQRILVQAQERTRIDHRLIGAGSRIGSQRRVKIHRVGRGHVVVFAAQIGARRGDFFIRNHLDAAQLGGLSGLRLFHRLRSGLFRLRGLGRRLILRGLSGLGLGLRRSRFGHSSLLRGRCASRLLRSGAAATGQNQGHHHDQHRHDADGPPQRSGHLMLALHRVAPPCSTYLPTSTVVAAPARRIAFLRAARWRRLSPISAA